MALLSWEHDSVTINVSGDRQAACDAAYQVRYLCYNDSERYT